MNTTAERTIKILEIYPYLRVRGAAQAIDFYSRVFGATESFRLTDGEGRIGHAEFKIGEMVLMLSDEYPELGVLSPSTLAGTTFAIHLHVADVDAAMALAVDAGAVTVREAADHAYGERSGMVCDPFGHEWLLGQEIERITPEEMQKRLSGSVTSRRKSKE